MGYSVGQVAGFAGVTVRTLHHYEEIRLLSPGGRSSAGHRRYSEADLDRLQRILFYRELGFPLGEVAVLLDDPESEPREHLRRQHVLLTGRIARLQQMVTAVEHAMEANKMGINLTPEERFEVFGDHDPERYMPEVERRWAHTSAYRESAHMTASHTKEDWKRLRDETDDLRQRFAALLGEDAAADSEQAVELAEEHRNWIDRNCYTCSHEIHTCLGEMYVADKRFTSYYDAVRPGLALFVRDAILANAVRGI
ncbi:MerR family transcriptional regulator [Streptomyces sp. NPDC060198]|uniref:MerR family transcriptional regulator n=1 Tax=Streptomyces sp. NPDC060198 TaxID=3347070 RepID=UPI00364EAFAA